MATTTNYLRVRAILMAMIAAALVGLVILPSAKAAFPGKNGDIAFSDGSKISTISPDGGTPIQVTDGTLYEGATAYSADGNNIAFIGWDGDDQEVYTIPSTGGTPKKVTNNDVDDSDPAFSPDGKKIAYTSHKEKFFENSVSYGSTYTDGIYTIPSSGGTATNVVESSYTHTRIIMTLISPVQRVADRYLTAPLPSHPTAQR